MSAPVEVERATRASRIATAGFAAILIALVTLPFWGGPGDMRLVLEMSYYLALAQLWNLLAGYAGLVSVGQQAFVGLGGYAFFYMTSVLNLNPFVALGIVGPVIALLSIPIALIVFRLRGAYFAVGTWVVSETIMLGVTQVKVLGAGSGMSLTPAIVRQIASTRAEREMIIYWITVAVMVVVFAGVYALLRSRHGLALTAIRDSEPASASLGVDTFRTKLVTYVVAAMLTGFVGAVIFLTKIRLSPEAGFSVNDWTVVVIFMVVIGGIGTLEGPIIGMLVYFALRELLFQWGTWYLILLGLVAVVVMLKFQDGIWGWIARRWDLYLFPVRRRLRRV